MNNRAGRVGATAVIVMATAGGAMAAPANLQQYRVQVNALCRSYTPAMNREDAEATAYARSGNGPKALSALGVEFGLFLQLSARIRAVGVPPDGRTMMTRPLRLLRTLTAYAEKAGQASRAYNITAFHSDLTSFLSIAATLNAAFDTVGLQDCGS